MYSKEKIYQILGEIHNESKQIKPYVVIAQPRRDLSEKPAQNFDGYMGLHVDFDGFSHGFCNVGGEAVDVARNYLIEQVIESGAKYLFFVGEDTVIPYDGFVKLHETAEKNPDSMVVGVYYIKLSIPMVMIKQGDYIVPANVEPGQLYEAWQTGLDAALIPVSLLKKLYEDEPELPFCCIGPSVDNMPFVGEDNFLVYRWRKMGWKLLVNTDVQCLHMDLANGKYTAHPDINENNYFTQIPLNGRLTMDDKRYLDERWHNRLPHNQKKEIVETVETIKIDTSTLPYKKLNLGSGSELKQGYINIDLYTNADMKMDIRKLEFEDNSIEEIFSSHTLEHFPEHEIIPILKEINRVLIPKGKLELLLPDFEYCIREWLNAPEEHEEKWKFFLQRIFGLQDHEGEYHKTGFTEKRIINLLNETNFEQIEVNKVYSHSQESLYIRAIKK